MMGMHISIVVGDETPFMRASVPRCRPGDGNAEPWSLAALHVDREGAHFTFQGDPERLLAFFDQARELVAREIAATWPADTPLEVGA